MAQKLAMDKLKVCICSFSSFVCPLLGSSFMGVLMLLTYVCRACAWSCVYSSDDELSSGGKCLSPVFPVSMALHLWRNCRRFLEDYAFAEELMRSRHSHNQGTIFMQNCIFLLSF